MNFPTEIIQNILSYSNDVRILKIKMNKTNIKYLFDIDRQLSDYLYAKTHSFTPSWEEGLYLTLINILNDTSVQIENVYKKLIHHIMKHNIHFEYCNYELYDDMLNMIINDYNEFYLNDYYYYHGYWDNQEWIYTHNLS